MHDEDCIRGNSRGLWARKIKQRNVRAILYAFQNKFVAVGGDVEVANVEIRWEISQFTFGPGVQVDEPQILMFDVSSQDHECVAPWKEGEMSSPASEGESLQRIGCCVGRDGLHGERCADVGP